jgi:hypothetical protein
MINGKLEKPSKRIILLSNFLSLLFFRINNYIRKVLVSDQNSSEISQTILQLNLFNGNSLYVSNNASK